MRRKYVAYIRVRNENDYEVDCQKKMIDEYAQKKNIKLDYYYIDKGYSGIDFNRPQLRQLLRDVKSRKVTDGIIFLDNTRLGRTKSVISTIVRRISKSKVKLISTNDEETLELMLMATTIDCFRTSCRDRNKMFNICEENCVVVVSPYKFDTEEFRKFKQEKKYELEKKGIHHVTFKYSSFEKERKINVEHK